MALFPGLPGWAGTRKEKPIWILLKQETVSSSGISWAIRKSASRSRQITMPVPHHSDFYRPDALPAAQPTASVKALKALTSKWPRVWKYKNAQKQCNSRHATHLQHVSQQANVFQTVLGFRRFFTSVETNVCTTTWWHHLSSNQITKDTIQNGRICGWSLNSASQNNMLIAYTEK